MRGWRFWQKEGVPEPGPSPAAEQARRFSARPRADLLDPGRVGDPAKAQQLERLLKRREAVLFDVERARQATEPDNPWRQRVALLDEASASAQAERMRVAAERAPAGPPLPPMPISAIAVGEGPPPRVRFQIGPEVFDYAEELDWAERGFQIARGELFRQGGDPARIVPEATPADAREALVAHLDGSLFVFASDLRDRALAGEPFPATPTLADLAAPAPDDGGWLDWAGHSPARAAREARLRDLDAEIERLASERKRETEEEDRWADRLPIALRRLTDVDNDIAALGG